MLNRIKNKDNILLTLQMKNIRKATIAIVGIYIDKYHTLCNQWFYV